MNLFFQKFLRQSFFFVFFSFLSGFLSGFLGTGGGIAVVFLYSFLFRENTAYTKKDIFAMTVMTVLFLSLPSFLFYFFSGQLENIDFPSFLIPSFFGGMAGAYLQGKIKTSFLNRLFALFMLYAGITMILK